MKSETKKIHGNNDSLAQQLPRNVLIYEKVKKKSAKCSQAVLRKNSFRNQQTKEAERKLNADAFV